MVKEGTSLKVGEVLGVSVKKKADADKFTNYTLSAQTSQASTSSTPALEKPKTASEPVKKSSTSQEGGRVFASPAAKTLAN